jgi:uncharacterized membrane protein
VEIGSLRPGYPHSSVHDHHFMVVMMVMVVVAMMAAVVMMMERVGFARGGQREQARDGGKQDWVFH